MAETLESRHIIQTHSSIYDHTSDQTALLRIHQNLSPRTHNNATLHKYAHFATTVWNRHYHHRPFIHLNQKL